MMCPSLDHTDLPAINDIPVGVSTGGAEYAPAPPAIPGDTMN